QGALRPASAPTPITPLALHAALPIYTATVAEDSSVSVNVRANDTDVDGDTLTVTAVGTPAHGTAVIQSGNVLYTPDPNYNGGDSFTNALADAPGGTDSAILAPAATPG